MMYVLFLWIHGYRNLGRVTTIPVLGKQDSDRFLSSANSDPPPPPKCKQAISMCVQVAIFISWLLLQLPMCLVD